MCLHSWANFDMELKGPITRVYITAFRRTGSRVPAHVKVGDGDRYFESSSSSHSQSDRDCIIEGTNLCQVMLIIKLINDN